MSGVRVSGGYTPGPWQCFERHGGSVSHVHCTPGMLSTAAVWDQVIALQMLHVSWAILFRNEASDDFLHYYKS